MHHSQLAECGDIHLVIAEFASRGVSARRICHPEYKRQKSPDLRLFVRDRLIGHCEVKSIFPVAIDIRSGVDPHKQRISNALTKAVDQLASVDLCRSGLWVVAFINHDDMSTAGDFQGVMAGAEVVDGARLYDERMNPNRKVRVARRFVDHALWFGDGRVFKTWNLQPHRTHKLRMLGMPERLLN